MVVLFLMFLSLVCFIVFVLDAFLLVLDFDCTTEYLVVMIVCFDCGFYCGGLFVR